jgi:hypothetical protein
MIAASEPTSRLRRFQLIPSIVAGKFYHTQMRRKSASDPLQQDYAHIRLKSLAAENSKGELGREKLSGVVR